MSGYVPPVVSVGASAVSAKAKMHSADIELMELRKKTMSPAELEAERAERDTKNKKWNHIATGVAGVSVASALMAMWWEASVVAYLAFIFPLFTAPFCVVQRRKLSKMPTLREEHNLIRLQVNDLAVENNALHYQVTKLQQEAGKLSNVEMELQDLAKSQNKSVSELESLVKQNGKTTREMKRIQETQVMQQVLTAIINSDRSKDWHIDESEMDLLVMRLRALPGVAEKQISEQDLRTSLQMSPRNSMASLYKVTSDLLKRDELELGK